MSRILEAIEGAYPKFIERASSLANEDSILQMLKVAADTPGPSGVASITRGTALRSLCERRNMLGDGVTYTSDAYASGCDVLQRGERGVRLMAHMDEVSYLISGTKRDGSWPLVAFCYHLASGPRKARVVRYVPKDGYVIVSKGEVYEDESELFFRPSEGEELRPGDRVVFDYPVEMDGSGGRVTGHMDNAAGVTTALVAAQILIANEIDVSVVLTDEEEGPSGQASQTISRGATRIVPRLDEAPMTIVIDVHGLSDKDLEECDSHRTRWGASMVEYSSHARGSVTPPHLYSEITSLADDLGAHDIRMRQNLGGYVSRSDDVSVMTHTTRLAILGYPGINRHFDDGLSAANLTDLRDLSISLAAIGAAVSLGHI